MKKTGVFDYSKEMKHEEVVFCYDAETNLRAIIAIHSTALGPAIGGMRMWRYKTEEEALEAALRLSVSMTHQSAITESDYGGGKAIIWGDPKRDKSESYFRAFGRFVNSLNGHFITYPDLGTDDEDLIYVKRETDYVLSSPRELGESLNSGQVTAYGVFWGMRACVKEVFGASSFERLKVFIQGVGEVGSYLCDYLIEDGASVVITDINYDTIKKIQDRHQNVEVVRPKEAFEVKCDIFSPNALGGILDKNTIPKLKCKIIAGAASNLLYKDEYTELLDRREILFAPAFVIGGAELIVSSKSYSDLPLKKRFEKAQKIFDIMAGVIARSKRENIPPLYAAQKIANERIKAVGGVRRIF